MKRRDPPGRRGIGVQEGTGFLQPQRHSWGRARDVPGLPSPPPEKNDYRRQLGQERSTFGG